MYPVAQHGFGTLPQSLFFERTCLLRVPPLHQSRLPSASEAFQEKCRNLLMEQTLNRNTRYFVKFLSHFHMILEAQSEASPDVPSGADVVP